MGSPLGAALVGVVKGMRSTNALLFAFMVGLGVFFAIRPGDPQAKPIVVGAIALVSVWLLVRAVVAHVAAKALARQFGAPPSL